MLQAICKHADENIFMKMNIKLLAESCSHKKSLKPIWLQALKDWPKRITSGCTSRTYG